MESEALRCLDHCEGVEEENVARNTADGDVLNDMMYDNTL
jgi:hypothetical protein